MILKCRSRANIQFHIYVKLLSLDPQLKDVLSRAGKKVKDMAKVVNLNSAISRQFAAHTPLQMEGGRNAARAEDIDSLKRRIGGWKKLAWVPAFDASVDRHTLGFTHETTGKMLCPVSKHYDWNNP